MSEWYAKGGVHELSVEIAFVTQMQSLGVESKFAVFYWRKLSEEASKQDVHIANLIIPALWFTSLVRTADIAVDLSIALNKMCSAAGLDEELRYRTITHVVEMHAAGRVDEVFRLEWMELMVLMPYQLDQVASLLLHEGANSADLYFSLKNGKRTLNDLTDAIIAVSRNLEQNSNK